MDEDPVNKLKSEMIKYESFSLSHREGNILYWWKTHSSLLPMLSRIARTILAIPSSSAKSERVFSTGGNTVTVKRSRLGPKRVEYLIVIKENLSKVKEFDLIISDYEDVETTNHNGFQRIAIATELGVGNELDEAELADDMFSLDHFEIEGSEDEFLDDDDIDLCVD